MADFTIDHGNIKAKIATAWKQTLMPLSQQVLKDCNYYCRQDQGTLIASSQIASQPEVGRLVWDTPYAQKVYYTGTPSTEVNLNASLMWCEKARAEHGGDWEKLANKIFSGG